MANFNILKAAIDAVIKANGQQEITGPILNSMLKAMVDSLGAGFELAGVATPSTNPGTPDQDVYWLAYQGGTYTNFGGAVLPTGISMLKWDGSWTSQTFFTVDDQLTPNSNNLAKSGVTFDAVMRSGAFDLTAYNGGVKYADLSAALTELNSLPAAYKRGGMSIKFVSSVDNKYVQYRYMETDATTAVTFINVVNWQGVDEEPIDGSKNLITSGSVYNKTSYLTDIAYFEMKENKYMDANGIEKATSVSNRFYIFQLLPNKKYTLNSILKSFSGHSNWIGVALFAEQEGADNLIKILSNVPTVSDTRFSCIVDTFGMSGTLKLKVCVATSNTPVLNRIDDNLGVMSDLVEPLGYSVEYGKILYANGGGTSTADKCNIFTFNIPDDGKVLFIDAPSSRHPFSFSFISLYKDGTFVTDIKKFSNENLKNGRLILNIGNVDANELKISAFELPSVWTPFEDIDYSTIPFSRITGTVSSAQLEGITLSDIDGTVSLSKIDPEAILSTNGYYNVLTHTSELDKTSIDRNGAFVGNTNASVVRSYAIADNTIIKIHFIKPNLSNFRIEGELKKNGEIIKLFPRLNSTAEAADKVIDNRIFHADELVLSVNRTYKNDTIVTSGAGIVQPDVVTLPSISTKIVEPTPVHLLGKDPGKFGIFQRLYIEGICKEVIRSMTVNSMQNVIVEHPSHVDNINESYTQSVLVSADGYRQDYCRVDIVKSKPDKLKNQNIKVLCVGSSLTQGGYPVIASFIGKCLNGDYCGTGESINILSVGTKRLEQTFSLGDYSYLTRGCHEGTAGRAVCNHLRHIHTVLIDKTEWDVLGLGTMTRNGVPGREYVSLDATNPEHTNLMAHTCHGWYDVENTEEVFNFLKNRCGITTFVYDGVTYTLGSSYSSDQYDVMVKAFKYFLTSSSTPFSYNGFVMFYDYDTVQSSNGAYAFNIGAYLNKFKTLDNDGTTRLTVGSTAGTFVTNSKINDYDLCLPSHVVLMLNGNYDRYSSDAQVIVDDMELMAGLIHSYDSSIKIALACNRRYGAINYSAYNDIAFPGQFKFLEGHLNTWIETKSRFANSDYDVLPIYAIQTVIGSNGGWSFDTMDLNQRQIMHGDYAHAATPMGYLDFAYEVVSWIASTYPNQS